MSDYRTRLLHQIDRKLDLVLGALAVEGRIIMSTLDDLKAEVHNTLDVEQSAIVLIDGIAAQLQAALDNNANSAQQAAAIAAVVGELQEKRQALAAAVTANTQPSPTPATPPAPQEPPSTGTEPGAGETGTTTGEGTPDQPPTGHGLGRRRQHP